MVSTIVIEAEGLGDSETVLSLSIDRRLIADNLTPEETQLLISGILDRISTLAVGESAALHWATEFGRTRRH
jgi:hypothetical protein